MKDGSDFIDELLIEAEEKETELTLAHYDLIIMEIIELQSRIEKTFKETEREIEIINDWALTRNSKSQDKIEFLNKKLEAFIRNGNEKTIELCHGTLKIRKKPDKVEIKDLELFLQKANQQMLTVVPETVKPSITGIKAFMKMSSLPPEGVEVIVGKDEFTLKLKEVYNDPKTEV